MQYWCIDPVSGSVTPLHSTAKSTDLLANQLRYWVSQIWAQQRQEHCDSSTLNASGEQNPPKLGGDTLVSWGFPAWATTGTLEQNNCEHCWPHSTATQPGGQRGGKNLLSVKAQNDFWKVGCLYLSSTTQTMRSVLRFYTGKQWESQTNCIAQTDAVVSTQNCQHTTAKRFHPWCSHKLGTEEGLLCNCKLQEMDGHTA